MGKILKKFPRCVLRQDTKTCHKDRRRTTSKTEKTNSLQKLFTYMLLSAGAVTLSAILLALLLAFLLPDPQLRRASNLRDPPPQQVRAVPPATFPLSRLQHQSRLIQHHAVIIKKMAPPRVAPPMGQKTRPPRTAKKN